MSDPRGTPRASKTAPLVMLLVFFQVLVVAVLGLGAIVRDREQARREALLGADREARLELDSRLEAAEEELAATLEDARNLRSFADLERLRDGFHDHADLIKDVYQVDSRTGVVYWMDGVHRLHVPQEVWALMKRQEEESRLRADSLDHQYRNSASRRRQIEALQILLREFPLRLDAQDAYPSSLALAKKLLELLAAEVEFGGDDETYRQLEQALLAALEVVGLNQENREMNPAYRGLLDAVPLEVEAACVALPPERVHIRLHVEAFRDAQIRLQASFRPVLEAAVDAALEEPRILFSFDHLVGLVPSVPLAGAASPRHLVVRMNLEAVHHFVEAKIDSPLYDRLGVQVQLLREARADEKDLVARHGLQRTVGLPYQVEMRRVRDPVLPAGGPSELFYWSIIALSAGGLGIGVWVLTRLYTRDVRLARLKADFVSNLSHELKTPLTSIGIFTELLQDGQLETEEERREGLAVLAQEAERLQGIVSRMLDVARREARGQPYDLKPGDLNVPAGRAAERFRRIVKDGELRLDVDLSTEPLPVRMDEAAMNDLVTNLLSNAWKYRRGDKAHIRLRTGRRGRRAEVVVTDDGLGIPRRERRRVFQMFYRVDHYLTHSASGTGLGLALVRGIVRAHKGSARIEAGENGVGTTFRIRFPICTKVEARPPADLPVPTGSPKTEAEATS